MSELPSHSHHGNTDYATLWTMISCHSSIEMGSHTLQSLTARTIQSVFNSLCLMFSALISYMTIPGSSNVLKYTQTIMNNHSLM